VKSCATGEKEFRHLLRNLELNSLFTGGGRGECQLGSREARNSRRLVRGTTRWRDQRAQGERISSATSENVHTRIEGNGGSRSREKHPRRKGDDLSQNIRNKKEPPDQNIRTLAFGGERVTIRLGEHQNGKGGTMLFALVERRQAEVGGRELQDRDVSLSKSSPKWSREGH